MKFIREGIILFASFILIYATDQAILADYKVQISALLLLVYFLISYLRRRKRAQKINFGGASDIFILNTIILLLVLSTGRLYSPLFFLLYFLCFGITFIFEPMTVFIFALGTIILLLPEALKNYAIESFIKLGSLLLISPLAYFFGLEYKKKSIEESHLLKEKVKKETIITEISDVLKKDDILPIEEQKKLEVALKQAKKLQE